MSKESTVASKDFIAHITTIRLVPTVRSIVSNEGANFRECMATLVADMRFKADVNSFMPEEETYE